MYFVVVSLHIIACLVLIMVILLQAGRGGGLSEGLGAGLSQSLFGTKTNVLLGRATAVCAAMFLVTCLVLNVMASRGSRSLLSTYGKNFPVNIPPVSLPADQGNKESAVQDVPAKDLPKTETQTQAETK